MQEISNTPEGVLIRLKNKICIALNIDIFKLKLLIDKFVNNSFSISPGSKTHFAKVNIYNELTKNKMTIKVFFKFLRILNIKKVKLSITITTPKDKEITVSEEINLFSSNEFIDD
jgi:hypothetical protein